MNDVWGAMSDPTRRKILALLRKNNMTAGEIADNFTMTKPSISHHLNILKQAELVDAEKKGQQIEYSINTTVLQDILGYVADLANKRGE
ncbi:autorepressor SdpR family transcription factor [Hydrogenoanaerobacterium sp.]|uniref:autorepressor SdpR family transcription factor n=1 Tax=Hydrogenoanaerobacterium sp. TaxID=2953763 RepID=UPI0028A1BF48|nr:autorepressor SdpR family transcription factor [Hydrogenoanaerobacterium sp.]